MPTWSGLTAASTDELDGLLRRAARAVIERPGTAPQGYPPLSLVECYGAVDALHCAGYLAVGYRLEVRGRKGRSGSPMLLLATTGFGESAASVVPRDDEVLPSTRVLSAVIVPFLVVAFVVLYGFPSDTDRLFAWTIKPPMTPMMLGGVYFGGAYFFVRAFRSSQWHTLKVGFVSVAVFASLMGVATLIHWDRFNHDHLAFWLWTGLYFTTPFLVAGTWMANRRTEAALLPGDLLVPRLARYVIGALGAMAVVVGMFMFLLPGRAMEIWPWALTPLTSRVLGAIFMLGLAGLGVFIDPRWSTARLMLQVQSIMMVLILLAAVRAHDDFDFSKAMTWLLLGGFTGTFIAATALTFAMDARAQGHS